ncbi:MAG: helix-turn-helix domain-containing protein [Bacteroidota bacterium]
MSDDYLTTSTMSALVGSGTLKEAVHSYERALILESLRANSNDKRKVAKLLGISISSLYRKLAELSIEDHAVEERA